MPRKPSLATQLQRLRPRKSEGQIPVGWWKDAKHRSQPPGSYLDPSLRLDDDGSPVTDPEARGRSSVVVAAGSDQRARAEPQDAPTSATGRV